MQKQRMLMLHFLTALSPQQKFVIEKLARLNLKETKAPMNDLLDDDPDIASPELENPKEVRLHSRTVVRSRNLINRRLVNIYKQQSLSDKGQEWRAIMKKCQDYAL